MLGLLGPARDAIGPARGASTVRERGVRRPAIRLQPKKCTRDCSVFAKRLLAFCESPSRVHSVFYTVYARARRVEIYLVFFAN